MNFKYAVVGLIGLAGSTSAFTPPKPFGVERYKIGKQEIESVEKDPTQHPALWRPPMKMVAGGAERAYGDDYYDGKPEIA
jgi:hypothetical protein